MSSILTEEMQDKFLNLLISEGLVEYAVIDRIRQESIETHRPIIAALTEQGVIDQELLTHGIAHILGVPYVNLTHATVDPRILDLLPEEAAGRFMAVPIAETQDRLSVAMLDASNVQAIDYISNLVKRSLKVYMASEMGIRSVLDQYRTDLDSVGGEVAGVTNDAGPTEGDIKTIVQDSPVSRVLSTILEYAVKMHSSDVHIEPLEDALKIRCRVDGVLREVMQLPKGIEPALVSRTKILAGLKIDEHRIPQDGQFAVKVSGKEVDLRIAISPVIWGEQVVIRLLDKTDNDFSLERMGLVGRSLRAVRKGIRRPNGMIISSGPTGSGKTTSLYALIKEIKSDAINIVTLEDPVEYKMPGVNQIQVNHEVGLTFASGLRSILRQDPDVVMVGEIRDKETANLAVQAALTGHLVFSTVHTSSASGVLPRLIDMGIEPYLIASTVNTIIGQRLVRRVAKNRSSHKSNAIETQGIITTVGDLLPKTASDVAHIAEDLGYKDLPKAGQKSYSLVKGSDSADSPQGYKGRAGLFEVLEVDESIQQLITSQATSGDIHRKAVVSGMITMRQDGYLKALQGITTIEEVNRVTADTV